MATQTPAAWCTLVGFKRIKLLFTIGSIFVLCTDGNESVKRLRTFTVIEAGPSEQDGGADRWTVEDDLGNRYTALAGAPCKIHDDLEMLLPSVVLRQIGNKYGVKLQFQLTLPQHLRVHHLSYLNKHVTLSA